MENVIGQSYRVGIGIDSPFPPADSVRAVMIVRGIRGKIIYGRPME